MITQKLEEAEKRFIELEEELASASGDFKRYQVLAKEHAELAPLIKTYRRLKEVEREIDEASAMLEEDDMELKELAKEELPKLKEERERLLKDLKLMLLPKDPRDSKSVFLEIRAGAGGEEAALFAQELFRMYQRYGESKGWKIEVLDQHLTDLGGVKEIVASVQGKNVYSLLKYESGVHRVQRVPETESGGRIHTSTATVAVLPEIEEVEVEIKPEELRIDLYRSSGPGGQHVNVTDSAVRITHLPTGIVVQCQDERSQHKNKEKAMRMLRAKLKDKMEQEAQAKVSADRRRQVGTGDRSERIRTYNFPQNRVTDHRIGLTLYKLDAIMAGELDELIEALAAYDQAMKLESFGEKREGDAT